MTENRSQRRAAAAQAPRANARGVASIDLGFRKLKLAVTLGAMADAEDAFGCDFTDIETALTSTRNIAKFIACLARAAGEEVSDEDIEQIRRAPISVHDLMAAIGDVVRSGEETEPGNAPAAR